MPGKKGQKMIARLSTSKKFHSVKELVFSLFEKNPAITKEEVEKVVKKEYPNANFLGKGVRSGHFSWYKHRWNRMKLENANFNIKEAHPKAEKENATDESTSHESKKDRTATAKVVDSKSMGKNRHRRKGGRVQVQSKKRSVVVKARKDLLQRQGSTKSSGRDTEDQKVSD